MARKPRLLLLDAGAVIAAKQFGVWDALVEAYAVIVPTIVIAEAHFYPELGTGDRMPIDLRAEVEAGRIREASASIDEMRALRARFRLDFRERMHEGEAEALAYLEANSDQDMCFVSADGPAIQAVAMLDLRAKAISLFDALQACGYTKSLPKKHGPEFVREHLALGSLNRILGRGLSNPQRAARAPFHRTVASPSPHGRTTSSAATEGDKGGCLDDPALIRAPARLSATRTCPETD